MRLRQICLVAQDLEPTLKTLETLFDSPVIFRDPGVAHFGLENGLIMTGGDFLEVVSPLPGHTDTAAGRFLARHGNGFYMLILQCETAAPITAHIQSCGVRTIFSHIDDDIHATHFHPNDFGGAIVSVDSMGHDDWQSPQAYWRWANWPSETTDPTDISGTNTSVGALAGLQFAASDPTALCAHWSTLLQRPATSSTLSLDAAQFNFALHTVSQPRVTHVRLHAGRDAASDIRARAAQLGLPTDDDGVHFCGVTWQF